MCCKHNFEKKKQIFTESFYFKDLIKYVLILKQKIINYVFLNLKKSLKIINIEKDL